MVLTCASSFLKTQDGRSLGNSGGRSAASLRQSLVTCAGWLFPGSYQSCFRWDEPRRQVRVAASSIANSTAGRTTLFLEEPMDVDHYDDGNALTAIVCRHHLHWMTAVDKRIGMVRENAVIENSFIVNSLFQLKVDWQKTQAGSLVADCCGDFTTSAR